MKDTPVAPANLSENTSKPLLVIRSRTRNHCEMLPEWPFGILYVADDHGLGQEVGQSDLVRPGKPAQRAGAA